LAGSCVISTFCCASRSHRSASGEAECSPAGDAGGSQGQAAGRAVARRILGLPHPTIGSISSCASVLSCSGLWNSTHRKSNCSIARAMPSPSRLRYAAQAATAKQCSPKPWPMMLRHKQRLCRFDIHGAKPTIAIARFRQTLSHGMPMDFLLSHFTLLGVDLQWWMPILGGPVRNVVGIRSGIISGELFIPYYAARSNC
jgi:hypothetical protein